MSYFNNIYVSFNSGLEGFTVLAVGSFADQSIGRPVFSVYEDRMHPWVQLPLDIEHMN